jgi:hypothetical protein
MLLQPKLNLDRRQAVRLDKLVMDETRHEIAEKWMPDVQYLREVPIPVN